MKKIIATLLCAVMLAAMAAGCSSSNANTASTGSKTINLWSFTDEVPTMVEKFLEEHPDFGYEVKTTIIATTDGAYPTSTAPRRLSC